MRMLKVWETLFYVTTNKTINSHSSVVSLHSLVSLVLN